MKDDGGRNNLKTQKPPAAMFYEFSCKFNQGSAALLINSQGNADGSMWCLCRLINTKNIKVNTESNIILTSIWK